jgi:hypothetical protein
MTIFSPVARLVGVIGGLTRNPRHIALIRV